MKPPKNITRRQFLTGAGAVGAAALLAGGAHVQARRNAAARTFMPRLRNGEADPRPNFIVIVLDSVRYDHIGFLGNSWIKTPNLDAFASKAIVFDKHMMGGFPTVLNRAEHFTGRWLYPTMGWATLPTDEVTLAERLSRAGYTTGMVFDTWLLKDNGFFFDRGFGSWEWVRGQLADRWRAAPPDPPLPADPAKLRNLEEIRQYLRNVWERDSEEDYLVARTMQTAIDWLERHASYRPFYLHIDSFDTHEPWDPPKELVDLYDPGYSGQEVIYPAYAPPDYLSPAELQHMRALYAADLTLSDRWLGRLFGAVESMGLSENTVIMVMADHGIMLGEHDAVGKAWERGNFRRAYPLWQELAHVPLMIRTPTNQPARSAALAQPADIAPTLLELAGIDRPNTMHGVSLAPILRQEAGDEAPLRAITVSSRSLVGGLNAQPLITVSDGVWTLLHGGRHVASHLFHLPDDPTQQNDRLANDCDSARRLHAQLIDFLESLRLPEATIAPWRPAPC